MWNYAENVRYPVIGADNTLAGKLIAEHILALGHKRIACMFPPMDGNDRASGRREVVLKTLEDAGVVVPEDWLLTTVYSILESKKDTYQLLAREDRPTALICGKDILATGALYGAIASRLQLPADLTVEGIDDFKGAADIEPALTTVRLPARRIEHEAGEALVAQIVLRPP